MPKIIDTADNTTTKLFALKAAGVESIIRYDCRLVSGQWKQVHQNEIIAIANAGLKIGIVYEGAGATPASFTQNNGYLDAMYSRRMAKARNQPAGSAIYFAVDFDPSAITVRDKIIPYFKGVDQAFNEQNGLPSLRFGAYCSGLCAEMLKMKWPQILIWITCSLGFRGSRAYVNSERHDLFQGFFDATNIPHSGCDKHIAGVDCDFDSAHNPDWGWFIPGQIPHPIPDPPPVAHDSKWLQGKLQEAGFYHGALDGDVGPLTIAAMIAYVEAHTPAA